MRIGLREVLLLLAVVLFIVAAISDTSSSDLLLFGLAAFAAAFLLGDVDLGRWGRGRRIR